jgi:hypothetical protein
MWKNVTNREFSWWLQAAETGWVSKRFDINQVEDESQVLFGINPFWGRITEMRIAIQ